MWHVKEECHHFVFVFSKAQLLKVRPLKAQLFKVYVTPGVRTKAVEFRLGDLPGQITPGTLYHVYLQKG